MKKLFALLAVVLAVVSCQKDVDNLDVNMGGDVATISVALPADAITRAAADKTDSAWSGLQNEKEEEITVTLYIFDENGTPSVDPYTQTLGEDDLIANFEVRLVPDRNYRFVAWAGQVGAEDNFTINTPNYKDWNIALNDWTAMNESRDAFTGNLVVEDFNSAKTIPTLELTRPFAKLRVITTDMEWITNNNVNPTYAEVSYEVELPSSFNAYSQAINNEPKIKNKQHSVFEIKDYTQDADGKMTLFTDYILAPEAGSVVKFILNVYEDDSKNRKLITSTSFTTDIPVKRNNLTTIKGNILTDGNNINVEVKPEFGDEGYEWPSESAEKLAAAAMFGGVVTLTENVVLNQPLDVKSNMTINLGDNELKGVINVIEGAKLTVNNGKIVNVDKSTSGITSNGDLTLNDVTIESARHAVRIESGNVVINGGTYKVVPISTSTLYALNVGDDSTVANVTIKGGTFIGPKNTMADSGGALAVRSGSTVTIEGGDFSGGKTKTLSANQNATLTVKGGTFDQDPSNYVATGYKAIVKNGKYVVVAEEVDDVASTNEELTEALKDAQSGDTIYVATGEYTALTGVKDGLTIDATGAVFTGKSSVSGNGAKIIGATFRNNFNSDADNCLTGNLNNTTFENCVFEAYSSARYCYANGDIVFNNCKFGTPESWRGIHFDAGNGTVTFNNCDLYGFQAFGRALTKVTFNGCNFYNGRSTNVVNMYNVFEYNDCKFVADYHCDCADNGVVAAFNNCSYADNSDITKIVRFDKDKTTCTITFNGDTYVAEGLVQNNGTYRVLNAAGLSYFSDKSVADGTVIELIADIDFNGAEFKAIAAGYNKSLTFKGNNHTIKNVKLVTCSHNTVGAASLFFCYPGGTINVSDLVVEGATSEGAKYVGTILGYTQGNATLKNITVKDSEISGVKKIGGLVGFVEASTTSFIAENCHIVNTNVVATEKQAGTILGYNAKPATLKGCTVDALSTATAPAYCDGGVRCTDPAQAELTIE